MLDITEALVARTINLSLNNEGVEKELSDERSPVSSFVTQVFPDQTIEHLGRKSFANVLNKYAPPSSLFFQAVLKGYMGHHAVGFRPEVLMYLINAVIAETIRRHPDDYRSLFTSEAGKVDIHVRHDGLVLGNPESPWDEAIELFDAGLRPHIPSRIMAQMLPEFSTASLESNVASLVAFMDAASPYYDCHVMTLCGIPRVVLFGEAADYRRLLTAAKELARLFNGHLGIYFKYLLPVIEKIEGTARGGPIDGEFWANMYKYNDASGGDTFGGWLSAFLWYIKEDNWETRSWDHSRRIPRLTSHLKVKNEKLHDWRKLRGPRDGIPSGSEPTHISRVPFTWHYLGDRIPMHFIGGVLGVDIADGALVPTLSYGVLRT